MAHIACSCGMSYGRHLVAVVRGGWARAGHGGSGMDTGSCMRVDEGGIDCRGSFSCFVWSVGSSRHGGLDLGVGMSVSCFLHFLLVFVGCPLHILHGSR